MARNKMPAYNIGLMKHYRPGEEEHKSRIGVSTKLNLFTYPWKINKILTSSDLRHLTRLLAQTRLADRYVMPFLDEASRDEVIVNPEGLGSACGIKWATSKSYVLINHWTKDFVRRRELAAGDEIGMCWDSFYSRFNFSVLKRAPTIII
ncbi:B3 domain-containing protein [Citrus sinensis]|uniref:B3 domain-containing protein n=1 Tax=Citrus sinensis TaxID=2711 RepID=A0ACB8JFR8_CITSI|nr:B3 domain-containing protein [Citrus sinensis]